jgi:hypothetical protein
LRNGVSKNTDTRKLAPRSAKQYDTETKEAGKPRKPGNQAGLENKNGPEAKRVKKEKKPGTAGLVDECLFRSAHFASLAI